MVQQEKHQYLFHCFTQTRLAHHNIIALVTHPLACFVARLPFSRTKKKKKHFYGAKKSVLKCKLGNATGVKIKPSSSDVAEEGVSGVSDALR